MALEPEQVMGSVEQCKEIVALDDNILLAAIVENANLLGLHFKKSMAPQTSSASRCSACKPSS